MSGDRPAPIGLAVAVNGAASVATWVLGFGLLPVFTGSAGAPGPADRLAVAAGLLAWPAAVVLAMVIGVVVTRVLSLAFNPIDDPESRAYRVSQRVLQNTVEQTAIFVPALLALAVALDGPWLGVTALATVLFVAGRLLFWAGYLIHPFARAPGMAMTFNVNAGMVGWLVIQAL